MIKFVGDICLSDNDFDKGFGVGSRISSGLNPFSLITNKRESILLAAAYASVSNQIRLAIEYISPNKVLLL